MTGDSQEEPWLLPSVDPSGREGREFRRTLERLRDQVTDEKLRGELRDVLDGRKSGRDLMFSSAFASVLSEVQRRWEAELEQMSPEERAKMVQDIREGKGFDEA